MQVVQAYAVLHKWSVVAALALSLNSCSHCSALHECPYTHTSKCVLHGITWVLPSLWVKAYVLLVCCCRHMNLCQIPKIQILVHTSDLECCVKCTALFVVEHNQSWLRKAQPSLSCLNKLQYLAPSWLNLGRSVCESEHRKCESGKREACRRGL